MITAAQIQEIVGDLISRLGLELDCDTQQDGDFFLINLSGGDTRYLERSHANNIGALVTVIKLIAEKRYQTSPKIALDFYGQRQRRLANVTQMAQKKAERVRITGQEEEMPPMPPAERRAVHVTLREMSGIRTESRGIEPHRRIVIMADNLNP